MENYLLFNAITELGEKYTCEAVRFDVAASDMEQMRRSIEIEEFSGTIALLPTAAFPEPERVRDETGNRESFGLTVRADRIYFYADTVRALAYALHTFSKFVRENGGFYAGVYSAFPRFKIRGMIEGFYGKPWTMAQREKAMQVMAENRMNTYIYGPKDDPYHRERWRELYDAEHLQLLQAMIRLCDSCHMDLQYMLAPGLDIEYGAQEECARILNKYRQVYALGVTRFGLLLDDIAETLVHAGDKARYTSLVQAHVDLICRVYDGLQRMDSATELVVCPTQYFGNGDEDYIVQFGRGIPPACRMFFTGEKICSAKITTEQARYLYENTGHKPLYWDNYPVNDMEMVQEYHISAIINRDPDLYRYAEGITLNPMESANCSLVALIPYAQYMWDSETYNPEKSYRVAVRDLFGADFIEPMQRLDSFLYKSCLLQHGYHYRFMQPTRHHETILRWIKNGRWEDLKAYMAESKRLLTQLERLPQEVLEEFARWYETALAACDAFVQALDAQAAGKDFETVTLPIVRYLCRPEDVLKYEAERLLYALYAAQPAKP